MKQFPAFINLGSRKTVIIGGGAAALAKARLVVAAGGEPVLIWPQIADETRTDLNGRATLIEATPARADLDSACLVFVAIEDDDAALRWARIAKSEGALVNVVDRPDLCDFLTPSIVDRGRLTVAISTGGAGPVFARAIPRKDRSVDTGPGR